MFEAHPWPSALVSRKNKKTEEKTKEKSESSRNNGENVWVIGGR